MCCPIVLPPLRERGDDVLLLIRHFVAKFSGEMQKEAPTFTERALALLQAYSWPGNVRELENIIQRLVLMVERDVIDAVDLPALMRFSADGDTQQNSSLAEVEEAHIRAVLAGVNGNKSRAAEILGIDRKTLREKIKEH